MAGYDFTTRVRGALITGGQGGNVVIGRMRQRGGQVCQRVTWSVAFFETLQAKTDTANSLKIAVPRQRPHLTALHHKNKQKLGGASMAGVYSAADFVSK